ncbi:hypothetical protein CV102_06545 [Natronococcus pandeyae]|uniref:Uncharacterized protein n=1 Tax=Natronococcus pandeyae TaxID=2055836 RepID=A0A8J8Q718_9EURY|nr:hypothetical protein [Natronococcus pandeyae]TYL40002.1 hypothetical protein CV102_06545 [Natronococcus pandeyae]
MTVHGTPSLQATGDALFPGTTVRYHYRSGDGLATVVERTERYVTVVGTDYNGTFTHDQIDRLLAADRLQIVLDDEIHAPESALSDP